MQFAHYRESEDKQTTPTPVIVVPDVFINMYVERDRDIFFYFFFFCRSDIRSFACTSATKRDRYKHCSERDVSFNIFVANACYIFLNFLRCDMYHHSVDTLYKISFRLFVFILTDRVGP